MYQLVAECLVYPHRDDPPVHHDLLSLTLKCRTETHHTKPIQCDSPGVELEVSQSLRRATSLLSQCPGLPPVGQRLLVNPHDDTGVLLELLPLLLSSGHQPPAVRPKPTAGSALTWDGHLLYLGPRDCFLYCEYVIAVFGCLCYGPSLLLDLLLNSEVNPCTRLFGFGIALRLHLCGPHCSLCLFNKARCSKKNPSVS